MKTHKDPRHLKRIQTVRELFADTFHKQPTQSDMTRLILSHAPEIDLLIGKGAPAWPVDKIGKIDLAILRQAVFELAIEKKTPPKVVIDEAVELAKEYGKESSARFINGVLGTIFTWTQKTS
ncbi:MAG: N utilization substance protein B-like protein [Microgenomates group bacterium GW2011_GWC1_41_8]|uniref:N utilization substance protein B-like protein n=2 Tax=Candidatus Roizmaniibacteriota TaxID=1752723 RepID=A0A0G0VGL9_9BACT|nr:MAG: N utilization substance protein B-like protein [Candidatus Levybacteria bacterium GW2011_GWA2_40_16]KKR71195.1 MAG: N utilization substance protein B-like protein [Candidatus Roizmanbacteria bacterium GW2011_GWB1_40_7]KKR94420.1 MAG: N utilization substance protein B-like protein [Candidatus Roizmanbacteria bacterium GW2011_GWA1_41_13]KKS23846.1 MAG: N utilization substance protein B-like protein [Microgenomates group bacterium GW2011_GWC1_41_8]OGK49831.1 MAG: transcription antiterminat